MIAGTDDPGNPGPVNRLTLAMVVFNLGGLALILYSKAAASPAVFWGHWLALLSGLCLTLAVIVTLWGTFRE